MGGQKERGGRKEPREEGEEKGKEQKHRNIKASFFLRKLLKGVHQYIEMI